MSASQTTELRSTPSVFEFNPFHIPYQAKVIYGVDLAFDYSLGAHELLLSGSVGSAKSILAAHLGVKHCLRYPRARLIIARRALPDIKKTIFQTIVEHLECEELKEGRDYFLQETTATIQFSNKSEIIPIYWHDKKFKRPRSINASAAIIEELTENDENDRQAFFEIKSRIGRIPHIKERWLVACTNPDSPAHWAYNYFIESQKHNKSQTRHVYYSRTEDNPFLDRSYIEQLKKDLDPKEARRLIYGEWLEINDERIYYAYSGEKNYSESKWEIKRGHPIAINFDFNIGNGKPMSSCAYQYNINSDDTFHVFDEVIVEGARTLDVLEEWLEKGIFSYGCPIVIHGDASGTARDTRSILSDYDLIKKFLAGIPGLQFRMEVPRENPPIRARHNRVNAYCENALGQSRLINYGCKVLHEGMRLTALKKGAGLVEDDSKAYQHVTTALGYGIVYDTNLLGRQTANSQRRG